MQTRTNISLIINVGLITLCLILVYPKLIQVFKTRKKEREKRLYTTIKQLVNRYLEELKND